MKKAEVKPSGPGALSRWQSFRAERISSSTKGLISQMLASSFTFWEVPLFLSRAVGSIKDFLIVHFKLLQDVRLADYPNPLIVFNSLETMFVLFLTLCIVWKNFEFWSPLFSQMALDLSLAHSSSILATS